MRRYIAIYPSGPPSATPELHHYAANSMIRDLKCDADTLAGPIDPRVVNEIRRHYALDDAFVQQLAACHGGVPKIGSFFVGKQTSSIGRFLTLLDHESTLDGEMRPHFEHHDTDERVMIGIPYVLEYEHQTSQTLFTNLVPFAALSDDMSLDQGYIDLLCLDFRDSTTPPPVVLWMADRALSSYMEWDQLSLDEQFDDDDNFLNVPWSDFLITVASDFNQFIANLKPNAA
ncbi:MAG: hypothetical protein AAGA75_26810 [Cyanobacteria bacterium P01_E01_bin.6]